MDYVNDAELLQKINDCIAKMSEACIYFGCDFSNSESAIARNEFAFDLLCTYALNIDKYISSLSKQSKLFLNGFEGFKQIESLRGIYDRDCDLNDRCSLQYVFKPFVSGALKKVVEKRYTFCLDRSV